LKAAGNGDRDSVETKANKPPQSSGQDGEVGPPRISCLDFMKYFFRKFCIAFWNFSDSEKNKELFRKIANIL
jgi:hypothetical protein